MIKAYYYTFFSVLGIILFTIQFSITQHSNVCWWFFISVIINILIMGVWAVNSNFWYTPLTIRDFEGKDVTVYTYQFNPFMGRIDGWITEGSKYMELNEKETNIIISKTISKGVFKTICFNILYLSFYIIFAIIY